jgi:hypothetical protein
MVDNIESPEDNLFSIELLDFLFVSCISTGSIIVSLNTTDLTEVFWHRRPACAGSLESTFP